MSATYRNQKSSTTHSDSDGASITVGPHARRSSIVVPYVVSVFGVRNSDPEFARGSVYPMTCGDAIPADRNPRRIATSDAPGIELRNTSIPRIKSSAS
jgi:hypothetical protein